MTTRAFTRTGGRELFAGHVISLHVDRFRFEDGEEVEREIVRHPGAVAIVAHDENDLYLVRQPRPAVGDPDVLELPAGLLDKAGEPPIETAARELKEEIGKAPGRIEHLHSYWSSVGSFDEEVHLFLATDLRDEAQDSGENERIEVVRWPLLRLGAAISENRDAKTLLGLLLLQARLAG
ncbi:MAG: NUDIX hydrolase [Solirubrobacterales bacterium]|nr:NUDIX hydrolase [Solirubrobacterales bacterium]